MRKTICILLILSLVLGLCLVLVGCNDNKEDVIYYDVTFIQVGGYGKTTLQFEANKPIGNNFKLWSRNASWYTFYTDKSCKTLWNPASDIVKSDLTLYAVFGD